jgi:hypothetical protein
MGDWLVEHLGDVAAFVTVVAFVISFATLAFSAYRYVAGLRQAQEKTRFTTYHRLLRIVSTGHDEQGLLKLVSQIAYIHELTNFRKYDSVTYRVLRYLRREWIQKENNKPALAGEIDRALKRIERRRWLARKIAPEEYSDVSAQQGAATDRQPASRSAGG